MSRSVFIALILLIAAVATAFRLSELSARPMHGDEAVNAFKLGETIEGRGTNTIRTNTTARRSTICPSPQPGLAAWTVMPG